MKFKNICNFFIEKKYAFIFAMLLIFLCAYSIFSSFNSYDKLEINSVNTTLVTNKVVVLDAGHGAPDFGALASDGTTESALNLAITLKLQKLLECSGAKVILTRSDENGIYSLDSKSIREKKISDIKNRVELGNNSNADIFVSIHLNKYPQSEIYRGWQTFYQGNSENSKMLAEIIQECIGKNIEYKNNRKPSKITDVYIMNNVKVPTVIVECGFLSNSEELALLKDESYEYKLAWGIFMGIQDYFYKKDITN